MIECKNAKVIIGIVEKEKMGKKCAHYFPVGSKPLLIKNRYLITTIDSVNCGFF